jgi:acyl transferase domain-containing protein
MWPLFLFFALFGCVCPAGDPIELGAATSVLAPPRSSSSTHHLLLSAFKSEGGHAEPAAGVVGLLRLAAQVRGWPTPGLLHVMH